MRLAINGRTLSESTASDAGTHRERRRWPRASGGVSIVGTDGRAYKVYGPKNLTAIGAAPVVMTAEQQAKLDLYRALDAAPRLPQERAYDDDEALEDLGIKYR